MQNLTEKVKNFFIFFTVANAVFTICNLVYSAYLLTVTFNGTVESARWLIEIPFIVIQICFLALATTIGYLIKRWIIQ